jgi:hypothetical protein
MDPYVTESCQGDLGCNFVPQLHFMKKVRTLSYPALKEQTYDAKGYPHVLSKSLGAVGVNF